MGIVLIIGRHVVGNYLVNSLADYPNAQAASGDVWNIVTERLTSANVTIVAVGILIVLWAWLSGAAGRAVALRRRFAPEGRDHPGRVWLVYAAVVALILLWGPTLATRQLIQSTLLDRARHPRRRGAPPAIRHRVPRGRGRSDGSPTCGCRRAAVTTCPSWNG